MMPTPSAPDAPLPDSRRRQRRGVLWLLALPYLGLCFPRLYARSLPVLFGFPFFYWYQLAWVLLASLLLGIVYRSIRD